MSKIIVYHVGDKVTGYEKIESLEERGARNAAARKNDDGTIGQDFLIVDDLPTITLPNGKKDVDFDKLAVVAGEVVAV
jgi:hypothetical protein